ncbi:MAG: exo-alpha-sialidase [Sedimentisphaerales bacterium]|nr:exo-alpha-sialidase [Sedimentisphaerales bacterium]
MMKKLTLAFAICIIGSMVSQNWADEITEQPGYIKGELIYSLDERPTRSCHASTIVEAADGTLVAAWFGGTHERNPDVGIWVSRLENGAWTRPKEVANGVMSPQNRYPCWNPVLFRSADDTLILFFKVGPSPGQWWGERVISSDNGKTWHDQRRLPPDIVGPIKNKPVVLEDGTILCPSSHEYSGWTIHVEITSDLRNWTVVGPLNDPNVIGVIQPTILKYKDGSLQMLCRTNKKYGFIAQTWSKDHGKSWSEVGKTSLPNPSAGIDAVTLKDGRQLLVYNPSSTSRVPLAVAISGDGIDWRQVITLERADAAGQNSYPAVIQTSDGLVHIVYTYHRESIKHVVLDPKKI